MKLLFTGGWPWWVGVLLASLGAVLAFWLYRRETKGQQRPWNWLPAVLRSLAIALTILMIAGPVVRHRRTEGTLGEVLVLLDTSASMGLGDPMSEVPHADSTRIDRALSLLSQEKDGLLDQLRGEHHLRLFACENELLIPLWDSYQDRPSPRPGALTAIGATSSLGVAISKAASIGLSGDRSLGTSENLSGPKRAVVLISDGQNNAGVAPIQVARVLGSRKTPIHSIGMGDVREPADLAVIAVDHPQRVFAKDRVRGKVVLKDLVVDGTPFKVSIQHQEQVLWSVDLVSEQREQREVAFELSLESLVEKLRQAGDPDLRYQALPVDLTVEVTTRGGDFETTNNTLPMRLAVVTQQYRILLADGRSRWETRYLKNAFQRDDAWQLTVAIVADDLQGVAPQNKSYDQFPPDRAALMAYDCIVIGDLPRTALRDEQQAWIRDFVELSGGGLIWIDGPRGHLGGFMEGPMAALLPVRRHADLGIEATAKYALTDAGRSLNPLAIRTDADASEKLWSELPGPHWSAIVEPLPASETLIITQAAERRLPHLVAGRFGAGQVAYFAADESWRWRYQVADTIHQRFWNQLARWVMRQPMSVSDDYVSLDTGSPSYVVGESAQVRARVTDAEGRGVGEVVVDALIERDGQLVATIPLTSDKSNPGFYEARTAALTTGEYSVRLRVSGFPAESVKVRSQFVVEAERNQELQRIACNVDLLKQMASESGGTYLAEAQARDLMTVLRPISRGHIIETETVLSQSYWWFSGIMLLLTLEWWLRKRAGLI